jgi:hypothetical protein
MKKRNKVKMGPLGTPLGNPLGYFNSLKGKNKVEPKQTLRKAQKGGAGDPPGTPFQSYMTTTGATAADTSATTPYKANLVTQNNPLLKQSYELTYGQDFGSSDVANPHGSFSSRRGDHSGYKDMNNSYRKSYEAEVAKRKKNK